MKKTKITRQQLKGQKDALKAQLNCSLYIAFKELEKLHCKNYLASGLIVTITDLNGRIACTPFMCSDGLESATIESLKNQIRTTLSLQELCKPKELR